MCNCYLVHQLIGESSSSQTVDCNPLVGHNPIFGGSWTNYLEAKGWKPGSLQTTLWLLGCYLKLQGIPGETWPLWMTKWAVVLKRLRASGLNDCLMTPDSYLKPKGDAQKLAEACKDQVQLGISFFRKLSFEVQNVDHPA